MVTLTEETRKSNARFFSSIDEVPTHALTMGIQGIMSAGKILLPVRPRPRRCMTPASGLWCLGFLLPCCSCTGM